MRLCANTGAALHLVEPFGFEWDDKRLRRAGLDYHALAHVTLHPNLAACLEAIGSTRVLACSTKGQTRYDTVAYRADDTLLFGPETRGLPDAVRAQADLTLRVPMQEDSRSLNLANSVAVVMYEAWRQLDFVGGS